MTTNFNLLQLLYFCSGVLLHYTTMGYINNPCGSSTLAVANVGGKR
jgi:hypothetical protein